jgi:hypothetical protein
LRFSPDEGEAMTRGVFGLVLAGVFLTGGILRAQQVEEEVQESRPHLQVLGHPYEIASFYRGDAHTSLSEALASRYPISSFYQAHQASPYGYSQFWTSGTQPYGHYARSLSRNGDLFLFAPFLAPVGTLTRALWEPR